LGSEQFQAAPLAALVWDLDFWPAPGSFFAATNFWFFDLFGESSAEDVNFYLGRYFIMLPLTPSEMGALGGVYLMPEFQPLYDFEDSHFSFWFGPEVGKMLSPGNIAYVKPGWGVDVTKVWGDHAPGRSHWRTESAGIRFLETPINHRPGWCHSWVITVPSAPCPIAKMGIVPRGGFRTVNRRAILCL
jgi:hypothetical protein